jgi:hypothetical protein
MGGILKVVGGTRVIFDKLGGTAVICRYNNIYFFKQSKVKLTAVLVGGLMLFYIVCLPKFSCRFKPRVPILTSTPARD